MCKRSTRAVVTAAMMSSMVVMFIGLPANDAEGQVFRRRPTQHRYVQKAPKKVSQEAKLVAVVREMQLMTVGVSNNDYDCFTDVNLRGFQSECDMVADMLRYDMKFVKLVGEIRPLSSSTKKRLFAKAAATYKPTWGQLGHISPRGQTVAGQRAERMVASTVVSTTKKMLTKPQSKLEAEAKAKHARETYISPPPPIPQ